MLVECRRSRSLRARAYLSPQDAAFQVVSDESLICRREGHLHRNRIKRDPLENKLALRSRHGAKQVDIESHVSHEFYQLVSLADGEFPRLCQEHQSIVAPKKATAPSLQNLKPCLQKSGDGLHRESIAYWESI